MQLKKNNINSENTEKLKKKKERNPREAWIFTSDHLSCSWFTKAVINII